MNLQSQKMTQEINEKNISLSIPFSSPESAALACEVLGVDKELKGSGVRRVISADGDNLHINFCGSELKRLRVAVNSFLKNVLLIVKTINQFSDS